MDDVKKLVQPFLTEEERYIGGGFVGKQGYFNQDNSYYALTNLRLFALRKIKDGSIVHQEIYLNKLEFTVLNQPSLKTLLRHFFYMMVVAALFTYGITIIIYLLIRILMVVPFIKNWVIETIEALHKPGISSDAFYLFISLKYLERAPSIMQSISHYRNLLAQRAYQREQASML